MSRRRYSGSAQPTTLASAIVAGDSSLTITDATGWPSGPGDPVGFTIARGTSAEEHCTYTNRVGLTLSGLTRGMDGTTALDHSSGVDVEHTSLALDFDEANALANLADAKGDLIVGSAADTWVRVPVGSNGLFLKANSAASAGIEWGTSGAVDLTLFDAKGDLVVGTGPDAVTRLPVGAANNYLRANPAAASGLEFADPEAIHAHPYVLTADHTTATHNALNITPGDGTVATAKIGDSQVTSPKIADLNVITAKLADLAVTTPKLADGAVTAVKQAAALPRGYLLHATRTSDLVVDTTTKDVATVTVTPGTGRRLRITGKVYAVVDNGANADVMALVIDDSTTEFDGVRVNVGQPDDNGGGVVVGYYLTSAADPITFRLRARLGTGDATLIASPSGYQRALLIVEDIGGT